MLHLRSNLQRRRTPLPLNMEQREGLKLDPETLKLHSRVAIVTGTSYPNWYRDHPKSIADTEKIRGDLALQAMREAVDRGYNIIVTDGGSSSDFLEEAKDIGEIVHPREGKERAAGRRQGYELASKVAGGDVIIWTEAEKVSLITALLVAVEPWSLFLSRFVVQSNLSVFFLTASLAAFFNREKNKDFWH